MHIGCLCCSYAEQWIMAGTNINEQIVAEIEKLKAVARCKIITNVGEFTHLITASVPDTEVLIKYQLTGLCR